MENAEKKGLILIGMDIRWGDVEKVACKVENFEPLAEVEGGRITSAPPSFMPYAFLTVEFVGAHPRLPERAIMPVTHREDFLTLWEVFRERGIGDEEDGVVYRLSFYHDPIMRLLFSRNTPWIHVYIFPKGDMTNPIAVYRPRKYR